MGNNAQTVVRGVDKKSQSVRPTSANETSSAFRLLRLRAVAFARRWFHFVQQRRFDKP